MNKLSAVRLVNSSLFETKIRDDRRIKLREAVIKHFLRNVRRDSTNCFLQLRDGMGSSLFLRDAGRDGTKIKKVGDARRDGMSRFFHGTGQKINRPADLCFCQLLHPPCHYLFNRLIPLFSPCLEGTQEREHV